MRLDSGYWGARDKDYPPANLVFRPDPQPLGRCVLPHCARRNRALARARLSLRNTRREETANGICQWADPWHPSA